MNDYPRQLKVVFKQQPLPFHKRARPAAIAALAANAQGKFWEFYDLLYQNMKALEQSDLERYARNLGLNMRRFNAFIASNKGEEHIQRDQALAAKIGARGTPTSFINGYMVRGAQPIEAFKKIIDRELKKMKPTAIDRVPRRVKGTALSTTSKGTPYTEKARAVIAAVASTFKAQGDQRWVDTTSLGHYLRWQASSGGPGHQLAVIWGWESQEDDAPGGAVYSCPSSPDGCYQIRVEPHFKSAEVKNKRGLKAFLEETQSWSEYGVWFNNDELHVTCSDRKCRISFPMGNHNMMTLSEVEFAPNGALKKVVFAGLP